MSSFAVPAAAPAFAGWKPDIARWTIAFTAFLGAFVIREPAPYELFLLVAMTAFLLFGLRLSATAITLGGLFILFNIGGMLSMFTIRQGRAGCRHRPS
ncbi:MAG: hypothetical protein AAFO70_07420, partial [Pseudomonadota bacterium]